MMHIRYTTCAKPKIIAERCLKKCPEPSSFMKLITNHWMLGQVIFRHTYIMETYNNYVFQSLPHPPNRQHLEKTVVVITPFAT